MPDRPRTPEEERAERRIEQRADKLAEHEAEQHVERRVEERVDQRADIKSELQGITAAIDLLIQRMDHTIPEERLQQLTEAVLSEERLSRQRLATKIIGFLAVILVLVTSGLLQSAANGRTLKEASTVADYVRDCLVQNTQLSPAEMAERCGDTTKTQTGFVSYLNCALLIEPQDRTQELLDGCTKIAFGG